MTASFDTLGYAKHLHAAGITAKQSEAHAEAARDFIMPQIATKSDIVELKHLIERQGLVLTVRLGGIMVVAVGALAAIIRLT